MRGCVITPKVWIKTFPEPVITPFRAIGHVFFVVEPEVIIVLKCPNLVLIHVIYLGITHVVISPHAAHVEISVNIDRAVGPDSPSKTGRILMYQTVAVGEPVELVNRLILWYVYAGRCKGRIKVHVTSIKEAHHARRHPVTV